MTYLVHLQNNLNKIYFDKYICVLYTQQANGKIHSDTKIVCYADPQ